MMALFIVLWLLNSSKPVKEAVAGYFKDPSGTTKRWAPKGPERERISPSPKTTCRS